MGLQVDEAWLRAYRERMGKNGGQRAVNAGKNGGREALNAGNSGVRESLNAGNAGIREADAVAGAEEPKRSKYGNRRTESDGKKFDSKHEAKVYEELRLRCLGGEFMGLALQVAFFLPGGIKYVADFVAFLPDGGYVVMDAKSEATRRDKVYRLKKRLMKECRKIEIQEV